MYIGAIPTPAATESRQEFTATANQTVFNTTGGTVGYCDCFLNGVKMANSDFSFDGADVTLTTGAAAGDVLAVVMRQADNALVALPITDSAGNNVLSETNNVVSISSGVQFPAGHIIQTHQHAYTDNTVIAGSTNTFIEITQATTSITTKKANSKLLVMYCCQFGSVENNHVSFQVTMNNTLLAVGNQLHASYGRRGTAGMGYTSPANTKYYIYSYNYNHLESTSVNAGTVCTFKLMMSSRGSDAREITLNAPKIYNTWGDNNSHSARSTVTIMEIAT